MSDAEQLAAVKTGLGITTNYMDAQLTLYIDEVKAYMEDAGVLPAVIALPASLGCILQGVNDIYQFGAGTAKYSEHFKERLVQLCYKPAPVEANEDV